MQPAAPFRLLNPEWQGYGLSPEVFEGAMALAELLWPPGRPAGSDDSTHITKRPLTIETPPSEVLAPEDGVLGLRSIAGRAERTLDQLRRRTPDRIFAIGGTCGTEVAPVACLNERYRGEMAVLWLDAHADLNTPATSPSAHFHGMVLRTLLGEGPAAMTRLLRRPLTTRQVMLAGVRDLDPPEAAYIAAHGIVSAGAEAFAEPERLAERVMAADWPRVYVHLDVDVINPADFSSALLPVPGGPTLAQIGTLLAALRARLDIVGLSILEYCHRRPEDGDRLRDMITALRF